MPIFFSIYLALINPEKQVENLVLQSKLDEALKVLDRAKQNPFLKNDPRIILVTASVLRQKKDFKAALEQVKAALAIHKKFPFLWAYKSFGVERLLLSDIFYQEALCYIELNDQETALKALDDAINVEVDPETLYQRALVLEYLGEFRDAEADLKLAIEKAIDPVKKEVALHNRADYFLRQKKNDLAIIDFKAALSQNECADAFFQLGRLALQDELYDQAIEYLNKSIEKEESVKALRLRALTHIKKEEWQEAKSDLDKAIKLEPDNKLVQTERENVIKTLKLL
ncbi:MAG: tetratricopeptide repeat protein [Candidatus Melainabacteria bacterium]|nr:MAG: tetratricopeptide repeat protein [Candidatus Melainabacteria bacterium]